MGSWYDRSFSRKKTWPNFFVTETQWPWLGDISCFFIYWTHDEWHEFFAGFLSLFSKKGEFCAWYMKFLCGGKSPMEQYLCLASGQTGGLFGKDFGGEGKSGAFLDLHDLEQKWQTNWLCDRKFVIVQGFVDLTPWRSLKIIYYIHSVHAAKNYTVTMGGSPNSAHQSNRSSKSIDTSGGWPRKKCRIFSGELLHLLLWNHILFMEELHHHWKNHIRTLIKILR